VKDIKIGFALCGSFCTFSEVIPVAETLAEQGADLIPIMSHNAYSLDTRFGKAEDFRERLRAISGKEPIHNIFEAEPIGPKKLLDILVIAPCTGNTLAKLANGIADTSVTLAAKAHLRNNRPIVIAVSSNDALSSAAKNIGRLMNAKNIFFVPMRQDDPFGKPCSIVADFSKIPQTCKAALEGKQLQPLFSVDS
jgi:dipicolinate synthase subunit B